MTFPKMKLFLTARGTMLGRNGKQVTFVSSLERDLSLEESKEHGKIAYLDDEGTIYSPLYELYTDGNIGVICQMNNENEAINKKYCFKIYTSFGTCNTIGRKTYQLKPRFNYHFPNESPIAGLEFDGHVKYDNGNSCYYSSRHILHDGNVLEGIVQDCRREEESRKNRIECPRDVDYNMVLRMASDAILNNDISPYLKYLSLK